jgi:hypothetical protein
MAMPSSLGGNSESRSVGGREREEWLSCEMRESSCA